MDNEIIIRSMDVCGIRTMCVNCAHCDKIYLEEGTRAGKIEYRCKQQDGKPIRHPYLCCKNAWEPNNNIKVLFGKEEAKTAEQEQTAPTENVKDKYYGKKSPVNVDPTTAKMWGLGYQYQKEADELKEEMKPYEAKIYPLEIKERALTSLIYENAKPTLLPHYEADLAEVSAQLDILYEAYTPMYKRMKELDKLIDKHLYYVPRQAPREKKEFVRPQTMMEGIKEDMPTGMQIAKFMGKELLDDNICDKTECVTRIIVPDHIIAQVAEQISKANERIRAKREKEEQEFKTLRQLRKQAKEAIKAQQTV